MLKINKKSKFLVFYHNLENFRQHCTVLKITKHIAKEKNIEITTIRPKYNKIVTITNDKNILMERVYTYLWLCSNLTTISFFVWSRYPSSTIRLGVH